MATTQKILTEEKFRELIADDKWIHNIANPVGCCDTNIRFKHYRTCSYPVEYIISEEQIAMAKVLQEKRKKECLESIRPGELVFVSMGMDCPAQEGEIGNHRIRSIFRDKGGRSYLIEFCRSASAKDNAYTVSECIDRGLEEKWNKDYRETVEWNREYLHMNHHRPLPSDDSRYPNGTRPSDTIRGTWDAVVNYINTHFRCRYASARKEDWFLRTEDFSCVPE